MHATFTIMNYFICISFTRIHFQRTKKSKDYILVSEDLLGVAGTAAGLRLGGRSWLLGAILPDVLSLSRPILEAGVRVGTGGIPNEPDWSVGRAPVGVDAPERVPGFFSFEEADLKHANSYRVPRRVSESVFLTLSKRDVSASSPGRRTYACDILV